MNNENGMSTAHITNLFERVCEWNRLRDNTNFNQRTEVKMLAEELFELCGMTREAAKEHSKDFAVSYSSPTTFETPGIDLKTLADTVVDAAGDLLFIAIGTIYKVSVAMSEFGVEINPEEVLRKICDANDQKGSKKDASGKIIKDAATFVEPVHVKN